MSICGIRDHTEGLPMPCSLHMLNLGLQIQHEADTVLTVTGLSINTHIYVVLSANQRAVNSVLKRGCIG